MRLAAAVFALAIAACLSAQESLQTYTYDVNGNRVAGPEVNIQKSSGVTETTERTQSINGRRFRSRKWWSEFCAMTRKANSPSVSSFAMTARDGPDRPRRFGSKNRRIRTATRTIRTTTLRGDINGNMRVAERTVANAVQTANGSTIEMAIERPSINDAFETVERRTVTAQKNGAVETAETVVQRRDENGQFYEAERETREKQELDGGSVENTARYERGFEGGMRLSEQTVRRVEKYADGSETAQVDVFRGATPGAAHDADAAPRLVEHQIVERRRTATGVMETMSVQRPSLADPSHLGPARQIAETVCRGKCESK